MQSSVFIGLIPPDFAPVTRLREGPGKTIIPSATLFFLKIFFFVEIISSRYKIPYNFLLHFSIDFYSLLTPLDRGFRLNASEILGQD